MLHTVIQKHSEAIFTTFRTQLQHSKVFSPPGVVSLVLEGMVLSTGAK
jgi:mediator of RNA polymerase II transcription subunit 14